MPRTNINATTRTRARDLRNNATPAERRLWNALRDLKTDGLKFRRQSPIGPFIVDFVCPSQMLVIEVDGHTHSSDEELAHDRKRTAYLEGEGYRVYRCTNDEVCASLDGIIVEILALTRGVAA